MRHLVLGASLPGLRADVPRAGDAQGASVVSVDFDACRVRAAAIWTVENLAERRRRMAAHKSDYPRGEDIAWLRSLGVYDVPKAADR